MTIYLYMNLSIHQTHYPPTYPSIQVSLCPPTYQPSCPCIRFLSASTIMYLSANPSIYPPIYPLTHPHIIPSSPLSPSHPYIYIHHLSNSLFIHLILRFYYISNLVLSILSDSKLNKIQTVSLHSS